VSQWLQEEGYPCCRTGGNSRFQEMDRLQTSTGYILKSRVISLQCREEGERESVKKDFPIISLYSPAM